MTWRSAWASIRDGALQAIGAALVAAVAGGFVWLVTQRLLETLLVASHTLLIGVIVVLAMRLKAVRRAAATAQAHVAEHKPDPKYAHLITEMRVLIRDRYRRIAINSEGDGITLPALFARCLAAAPAGAADGWRAFLSSWRGKTSYKAFDRETAGKASEDDFINSLYLFDDVVNDLRILYKQFGIFLETADPRALPREASVEFRVVQERYQKFNDQLDTLRAQILERANKVLEIEAAVTYHFPHVRAASG